MSSEDAKTRVASMIDEIEKLAKAYETSGDDSDALETALDSFIERFSQS